MNFFKKSEVWLLQAYSAIAFGEEGLPRCYHCLSAHIGNRAKHKIFSMTAIFHLN